jgi:hypothetical protein
MNGLAWLGGTRDPSGRTFPPWTTAGCRAAGQPLGWSQDEPINNFTPLRGASPTDWLRRDGHRSVMYFWKHPTGGREAFLDAGPPLSADFDHLYSGTG